MLQPDCSCWHTAALCILTLLQNFAGGPSYACWDVLPRKYGMSGSTLTFECGFTSVSTKQLSDILASEGAAGPAGKSLQSSAFVHAVLRYETYMYHSCAEFMLFHTT